MAKHLTGQGGSAANQRRYALLNNVMVRDAVLAAAANRYGYRHDQVELRLYVGRFAGPTRGDDERAIREWCSTQRVGVGPIRVVGLAEVARTVRRVATTSKQYRDNATLTAIKVLDAAGMLHPPEPDIMRSIRVMTLGRVPGED
ncbi:MAG: hypothetical protein LC808_12780 [Actinobacteria bacterium]|nr:hypothetical protein [Actinomycetota bacterium]